MDAYARTPEEDLRSAGAETHDYGAASSRFKAKTLAECLVDHAASYIIKGVIAPRDLALIFAQPGAGKTLLGPLLAHAAATGRPVFGRRTRACRVLYIAAEAPRDTEARFVAMRQRYGEAPNLHFLGVEIDLQDPDSGDLDDLRAYIAELKPDLIFLDTLAAAFPGLEENESRDMGRAAKTLRLLGTPQGPRARWEGAAVAAIHHAPKGGDTPRGHGSLNANADVTMRIEGQDAQTRSVVFGKNRNGPSGHAFDFEVEVVHLGTDQDGDPITRPIAVEADEAASTQASSKRRSLSKRDSTALGFLHDLLCTEGKPLPPAWGMASDLRCVPLTRFKEECERRGLSASNDARNRMTSINQAVQALNFAKALAIRDGVVWAV
ncbi:AAA family ATPase [Belnapia sp. T18]|uniref:AAA family ATPase n=1 Tax=Belnapia arida TaxID=2804533 RepID=A0ABS1UCV6_9PROT|nr:AAA family ATPase [Belnapia arida]MBL6082484.1 AAA family ATPase [Belnapia arida]